MDSEYDKYFGEEAESIYSADYKQSEKYRNFLQYLCDKGVALGIVKFLLSVRRNEELPESPIEAMTDYFGSYGSSKNSEIGVLAEQVEQLKVENKILFEEIDQTEQEIERKKIEKEQAELARRAAEEEEARKKTKKGPGVPAGGAAAKKK